MSMRITREASPPAVTSSSAPGASASPKGIERAPGAAEQGPSPFARILRGIGNEVDRGERLVSGAIHGGRDLGAQELLALQAGVYRYSEAVDLAAKLVDRASTGVKTIIQGQ
jgi:hypothetical protein